MQESTKQVFSKLPFSISGGKNVIPKHPSRHPVIDAKGSSKVAFLAAKSSLKSFTSIFHDGRISYKIYIGFMCFTKVSKEPYISSTKGRWKSIPSKHNTSWSDVNITVATI